MTHERGRNAPLRRSEMTALKRSPHAASSPNCSAASRA
jgi:hypothetical protein